MVNLGSRVRDTISGFEGIATGRTVYLNGCVSVLIEGPMVGKDRPEQWIDEQRLEVIEQDAFQPSPSAATAGGPVYPNAPHDPWGK